MMVGVAMAVVLGLGDNKGDGTCGLGSKALGLSFQRSQMLEGLSGCCCRGTEAVMGERSRGMRGCSCPWVAEAEAAAAMDLDDICGYFW